MAGRLLASGLLAAGIALPAPDRARAQPGPDPAITAESFLADPERAVADAELFLRTVGQSPEDGAPLIADLDLRFRAAEAYAVLARHPEHARGVEPRLALHRALALYEAVVRDAHLPRHARRDQLLYGYARALATA